MPRLLNSQPKRVFCAVLVLVVIFSPTLYAFGWHLRYGGVLTYKDKHVTIPAGWIANAQPQGLDMTELPRTIFTLLPITWAAPGIHLHRSAPLGDQTVQQAEESFQKGFLTYPPGPTTAILSGPIQMGVPPNDVFCMRATSTDPMWPVSENCLLQQGVWMAFFNGDEKDVGTFYAVLRSVQ